MSEPAALILRCRIAEADVMQFLHNPSLPFAAYDDWDRLGLAELAQLIANRSRFEVWRPAKYLGEVRSYSAKSTAWRFDYDVESSILTCVDLLCHRQYGRGSDRPLHPARGRGFRHGLCVDARFRFWHRGDVGCSRLGGQRLASDRR